MRSDSWVRGLAVAIAFGIALAMPMPAQAEEDKVSTRIEAEVVLTDQSDDLPGSVTFPVQLEAIGDSSDGTSAVKRVRARKKVGGTDLDKAVFEGLSFSHSGDYYYRLRQLSPGLGQVTWDQTEYTVMVRVEQDEKAPGGLAAAVSGWKGGLGDKPEVSEKPDAFVFYNHYKKASEGRRSLPVQTGDYSESSLWLLALVLSGGLALVMKHAIGRRGNE